MAPESSDTFRPPVIVPPLIVIVGLSIPPMFPPALPFAKPPEIVPLFIVKLVVPEIETLPPKPPALPFFTAVPPEMEPPVIVALEVVPAMDRLPPIIAVPPVIVTFSRTSQDLFLMEMLPP